MINFRRIGDIEGSKELRGTSHDSTFSLESENNELFVLPRESGNKSSSLEIDPARIFLEVATHNIPSIYKEVHRSKQIAQLYAALSQFLK